VLSAADSSPKLVQLRQAKTLRVFNEHHRRVGNIYTDLKHRGADQRVCVAVAKTFHDLLFLRRWNSTVK
jgi:hypothetical protein